MKKAVIVSLIALVIGGIAYAVSQRFLLPAEDVFVGEWVLDPETTSWLGRTCALMEFPDGPPRIEIDLRNGDVAVRFNNRLETVFVGRMQTGRVVARQMIPATDTGRFCGDPLNVRLRLNIGVLEPDELQGHWRIPGCDVCPDQSFNATRAEPRESTR